jgi:putative hydrolase
MSDSHNGFGFTPEDPFEDDENKSSGGENQGGDFANPTPHSFSFSFPAGFISPENMNDIMGQLGNLGINPQTLMNAGLQGSIVNREHVREIARKFISANNETPIGNIDISLGKSAFEIADTWLDGVVNFPATTPTAMPAWSRRDWLDASINTWHDLVEPLADGMANALTTNFTNLTSGENGYNFDEEAMAQMGLPSDVFRSPQFIDQMKTMMRTMMGLMVATQLGQALGQLATSITGSHDIALPIFYTRNANGVAEAGKHQSEVHLLPQNVARWADGLGIREDEVRIYLALRESAAARLFTQTPWLYEYIRNAFADFGRGITINMQEMSDDAQAMLESGEFDPTNPQSLNNAIAAGLFTPEQSELQNNAIARIEMILALIEGWMDHVVTVAAADRLPSFALLNETQRRSRATNSPVAQLIKNLLGAEISPRTMRECASFWNQVLELRGSDARDARWEEVALLPNASQLSDVPAFLASFDVPDDLSGLI